MFRQIYNDAMAASRSVRFKSYPSNDGSERGLPLNENEDSGSSSETKQSLDLDHIQDDELEISNNIFPRAATNENESNNNVSTQTPPINVPRLIYPLSCIVKNNRNASELYVIGGASYDPLASEICQYMLAADGQIVDGPFPVDLVENELGSDWLIQCYGMTATAYKDMIYMIGSDEDGTSGVFKFDPSNRTIKKINHREADIYSQLPQKMANHNAALVDYRGNAVIACFGGTQSNQRSEFTTNYLRLFDIETSTWTQLPRPRVLPPARLYHAMCGDNESKLYVFGGAPDCKTTTQNDICFNDLWSFDISTQTWTRIPLNGDNIAPRGSCGLVHEYPFLYLYGGVNGTQCFKDSFEIHIKTGRVKRLNLDFSPNSSEPSWAFSTAAQSIENQDEHAIATYFVGGVKGQTPSEIQEGDRSLLTDSVTTAFFSAKKRSLKSQVARFIDEHGLDAFDTDSSQSGTTPPQPTQALV